MVAVSSADPAQAFARAILSEHRAYLLGYLRRRGVHANDLEDVLQEVVAAACAARASYDPSRSLRTWLIGVAWNHVAHYLRGTHRNPEELGPEEALTSVADAGPGPEDHLITRDRLEMLDQMVASMPEEQRDVFLPNKLEEIPMPAVAEAKHLNPETAWSRCKAGVAHCVSWFHRWQAAERARGRDGTPLVLIPRPEAPALARRDAPPSSIARCAWPAVARGAVLLTALGCMSPAATPPAPLGAAILVEPGHFDVGLGPFAVEPGAFAIEPGAFAIEPGAFAIEPGAFAIEPGPRDVAPGAFAVEPGPLDISAPPAFASESRPSAPPVPTLPRAASKPAASKPAAPAQLAPGAASAAADDRAEWLMLQAEAEHRAGNDAQAAGLLLEHAERFPDGSDAAKRNALLREIDSSHAPKRNARLREIDRR